MEERVLSAKVPINLKPYQGLKHSPRDASEAYEAGNVPINLKPYQGLKRPLPLGKTGLHQVPINLKPYQGLKLNADN